MENTFLKKSNVRKKILCMLMCICAAAVFAVQPVNAASMDSEFFTDSHMQQLYTSRDGLPATSTTAITQTSDGFIWLGGYGGLAKYDGREFSTIGAGQISNVKCLLRDDNDILWIGSSDKGLATYQNNRITFLGYADEEDRCSIECIVQDGDGHLYFGTEKGLGTVNDESRVEILKTDGLYGQLITHIVCVGKKLYCMTKDGMLYSYDGRKCREIKLDIGAETARCISYSSEKKQFFIGTEGSVIAKCSRDFSHVKTVTVDEAKCINDIMSTAAGNVWICADNGVMIMDSKGTVKVQKLMVNNSIDDMMIDMEGNKWFISSRQGVLKISNSMFMNINQSAKLGEMVANAVYCRNGKIYIGHDEGISIVDEDTLTEVEDSSFDILKDVRIRDIYRDSEGTVWFSTNDVGMLCRDKNKEWKTYSSQKYPEIQSNNFRCADEMKDGSIIAGSDSGAYVIKDDEVHNLLKDPEDMTCRVLCVATVGDTCYVGTDGYGMYAVKGGKIIKHYGTENGLTSNVVMKIRHGVTKDVLWVVTGNNVAAVSDNGKIANIEKFPATNILDIVIQKNGIVWIPTGGGVYRITEGNLLDDVMKYDLLTRMDGMPFDCTANSHQCIEGSTMYLCGTEGVFSVDIERFAKRKYQYPITVDYVTADTRNLFVKHRERVEVDSDTERISMQVHVPTYIPENPTVFYYLDGVDKKENFIKLRDLDSITYTNIAGGDYNFYFGIINDENGEVLKQTKLTIEKEKKFIETTFARVAITLLTFILFLTLCIAIARRWERRKTAAMEEMYKQREQEKLEQMAYQDYLTGLYNRNQLNKWSERQLADEDYPVSIIMADCNNLKAANDMYGHAAGNKLIQETAEIIRRQFETDEDKYTVARIGGDEFAVICCGTTEEECRTRMENAVKDAAGRKIEDVPLSFCYGIAGMQKEDFDLDECLKRADIELVNEKRKYHELHGTGR